MVDRLGGICATRALKNAVYLQRVAPHIMPDPEPAEGFGSIIPWDVLALLHSQGDRDMRRLAPDVAGELRKVALPVIANHAVAPLFNGTIHFARLRFTVASQGNAVLSVSDNDTATAIAYATRAVVPISQYAQQYGPNSVTVSPNVIQFDVFLPQASGATYNNATLQSWVNQIAHENSLASSACVAVLNPQGIDNVDGLRSGGNGGYHRRADIAFIFVNVNGQGLTVADRRWEYAGSLSHEIAEMVVDPNADSANPEVCDPCGPNCASTYIDYFDAQGSYIETSQTPPYDSGAPSYGFYINGIVTPEWAKPCPVTVPPSACAYSPGSVVVTFSGVEAAFQANTGNLWIVGTDNRNDMGLGMMAGTSPSIAALPGGGWQAAFQANTGNLWIIGTDNRNDMGLGMMAGTSPSIAALPGGGWQAAFQANTGNLWIIGAGSEGGNTDLGMLLHSSPRIAAVSPSSSPVLSR
ncbi:MAG: hypothetical protein JOZ87_25010 [Chloroflexi bacterium]|nr:hypothetical protein [Chloroflexota bacterium]